MKLIMTNIMNTQKLIPALCAVMLPLVSCSDDWDSHYNSDGSLNSGGTETVFEMVNDNPELSKFARMIEIAGYDDLLASSQTFTVFAPVDDALADIDLSDVALVKRIVANHIARYNNSSATSQLTGVKMYNGKRFFFDGNSFGGAELKSSDAIATNGLLHVVASQIPYVYNIREYIDTHDNTSEIAKFLKRFDQKKLDLEASVAIGVNENGQTVYDSVLIDYNPIYNTPYLGLGAIADEDSTFTMIIPDDIAWRKAYERISPYFKVYDADKAVADSIADVQTSLAILGDLTYRTLIPDPSALDMIVSTSGSEITNVVGLFLGTVGQLASNGWIYTTSMLNYDNTLTWNKEIEVEAELQTGRTPGSGTNIFVRNVESDNALAQEISEMSYIEVSSTSTSRQPGVTFSIPDVLSGKYDIYVSIVPANVLDASVQNDSTRLAFTLSYRNTNGRSATKTFNEKSTKLNYKTSPDKMTLIKVTDAFEFPVSNYYDRLWLADETHSSLDRTITTTLYVTTDVTNAEFRDRKFTRRFNIDRIILVPIKN